MNRRLIGKISDAGRLRTEEEEGIKGWDDWIALPVNEHEIGQTPGDGEGQGGLGCCSPQDHRESDVTGQLNNNNGNNGIVLSSN